MTQPLTAIPLGRDLRHGSSHLPASSASRLNACLFGVAPGGGCRVSPLTLARQDSSLWPYSSPSPQAFTRGL